MNNPAILICPCPISTHMGSQMALRLGCELHVPEVRCFPDGEICVCLEPDVRGRRVILLQNTCPPQHENLQRLFQAVEATVAAGADGVTCVVPYLAYARQDKRSAAGEPLSGAIVLRTLAMLGASRLLTIDVHNPAMFESASLRCHNVSSTGAFANYFRGINLHSTMVVSADEGGRQRAVNLAASLRVPSLTLKKSKDRDGNTFYRSIPADVDGREIVVIDDLCSSGSTLVPLVRALYDAGAKGVTYAVTHFFANGDQLLERVDRPLDIVASDTIPSKWSRVSIADELCDAIA